MRPCLVVEVDNSTPIVPEFRDVCYPWHPWFGRTVAVYEVLVKQGQSVSRCGLEEERNRRAIEVPTWMFEPAACRHLRLMLEPAVSYDALRGVQALLRIVPRSDPRGVLQAQHRCLPAAGGADAPVHDRPATFATDPVSSRTLTSVVSHITPRDPIEDGSAVGTVATGARRWLGRGRPSTGRRVMSDKIRSHHQARKAILYIRQSSIPHGSEARPRVGSRRPSPGPGVGSRRRPSGDHRAVATGGSSTTRSRGDATPRPWRVGRPPRPISNPATRLAVRSRTADRTNPWWASVGCADREPAAAVAPGSREPDCGVGLREQSVAEQRG